MALSIRMVNAGQFSWDGEIQAGGRVVRPARFSDNSFVIRCRDRGGEHTHGGGYVTNGTPQIVDIKVSGCANVTVDVRMLP